RADFFVANSLMAAGMQLVKMKLAALGRRGVEGLHAKRDQAAPHLALPTSVGPPPTLARLRTRLGLGLCFRANHARTPRIIIPWANLMQISRRSARLGCRVSSAKQRSGRGGNGRLLDTFHGRVVQSTWAPVGSL